MRKLLLLLACFVRLAQAGEEVLPPEQAFRFSVRLAATDMVEYRYAIAEGYYLYRDKFQFASGTNGVTFGAPELPPGKLKEDEFFGKVETYRGDVVIRVPMSGAEGVDEMKLKSQFQGCADVGICYTPQTRWTTLKLAMAQSAPASEGGLLSRLKNFASTEKEEEFLPVEQAFKVNLTAKDAHTLVAEFKPAEGYYLYRDKTSASIAKGSGVSIDKFTLPRGEKKSDPNFGDTEVFHRPFQAIASLKRTDAAKQEIAVDLKFQGCSEKGLCYPPTTKSVQLTLAALATTAALPIDLAKPAEEPASVAPPATARVEAQPLDETTQVARLFRGTSFWALIASFFGFGLLLALTPCVFPMIPILSGIIAGQGAHLTRTKAVTLSAVYVLGMAITYALAGVAAGLSGSMLSATLQNAWVLGAFALIFVALALSMFGFYELQVPSSLQTKFAAASSKQKGGTVGSVFIMGVLSALIVGPCVAAPLAGALVYIGQSRDVVLGGSALFAMALGMGAPLLLVGWSAGALLPKAGAWMQSVKNFFGVLLLAVAIWLISPVIPAVIHMLLWAALLIVSAIYLHAIDPLPAHTSGFRKLWKGVGVIMLLIGVALLVGALAGGRDPLQPLSGFREGAAPPSHAVAFERVRSTADLDQRIATANGRPVMLDFYADWCVSCKEMELFTFSDPKVEQALKQFVLLQADVTHNTAEDSAILKRFGLFGPPGIIFFRRGGQETGYRVVGYQPAEKFLEVLNAAAR
ncbi:MAG: protein-disulfide reductase DsbD [Betaproteobacteria bacterium]|nr:protein-disulfide reductase DsbD [Betaproteobacteria bacterium]